MFDNTKYTPATRVPQHLDLLSECILDMSKNGLPCPDPINLNGKIQRYSADSNPSKKDEWLIGYEGISTRGNQYLCVTYGCWGTGEKYTFKSWDKNKTFSVEEKNELELIHKKKREEVEKELYRLRNLAAEKATKIWQEESDISPSEDYLQYPKSKGIEAIGVKFGLNQNSYPSIIVPIKNIDGNIRSLQYISMSDASERSYKGFHEDGEKKGNFCILGSIVDGNHIYVAEGYGTAVSIYMAMEQETATVVAFDAGNIDPVMANLKRKYPNSAITIAGDADVVGRSKANDAAKMHGCQVAFPVFPQEPEFKDLNDFNDLHQFVGLEEVARQLEKAVAVSTKNLTTTIAIQTEKLPDNENPCEDFFLSKLPSLLRDYISPMCEETSADPIMITMSTIATISAFAGKNLSMTYGSQMLYPNLWMLSVTESGNFKTTALNLGASLAREREREVNSKIKTLNDERLMLPASEKTRIVELEKQILQESVQNVLLPQRITAEAFLRHLAEGHRGVILTSEFGPWLQNLEGNRNSDFKGILTDLYDMPKTYRNKTKTQGDDILEEPFFSICGVSTPAWLRENLKPNDVDGGVFARFLLFNPKKNDAVPPAWPTSRIVSEQEDQARAKIKSILQNANSPEIKGFYCYTPSKEARNYYEKHIYQEKIYGIKKSYEGNSRTILDPYFRRWAPTTLKLAMIMQLLIDENTIEISEEAMQSAEAILLPAIKSTIYLFEKDLGESKNARLIRELYEWMREKAVKKKRAYVTRKEVFASNKAEAFEYNSLLDALKEQGKIIEVKKDRANDTEYYPQ